MKSEENWRWTIKYDEEYMSRFKELDESEPLPTSHVVNLADPDGVQEEWARKFLWQWYREEVYYHALGIIAGVV